MEKFFRSLLAHVKQVTCSRTIKMFLNNITNIPFGTDGEIAVNLAFRRLKSELNEQKHEKTSIKSK